MELRLVTELAPSVNHAFFTARNGMRILKKDAKAWVERTRTLAMEACEKQGWAMTTDEKLVVDIMTYWKDRRRHDVHNGAKVLLDALEGIIYKDDKMVLPRYIDFGLDRENPRLEMVFRRYDPEVDKWSGYWKDDANGK
ncbi:RusA family crossover junction endodeoxyribonuclease [Selenomonas ruminantium]|uniref:Crossover junction endodeoxyribonuclease RusA n=1 Tax=Selenomonas ruminantium TaxID=971 RepID=A0A1I0YDA1_SELRU|nr:RusA family crossover junction endodeoxyribonuclease [Selenomonas ruminantium]SFB10480.1 crossover junction endodeoxyribonuclease RusA [Selenomonas ruminantium]